MAPAFFRILASTVHACPDGYDGRNCEQTSATFIEGSYAVYPLDESRLEGSFSIDFITENRNGLLAFVGRYDNDFSDFISVELTDGRPTLRVSYGSMTDSQLLLLENPLNDRRWHTILVEYSTNVNIFYNLYSSLYLPLTQNCKALAITLTRG